MHSPICSCLYLGLYLIIIIHNVFGICTKFSKIIFYEPKDTPKLKTLHSVGDDDDEDGEEECFSETELLCSQPKRPFLCEKPECSAVSTQAHKEAKEVSRSFCALSL